MLLKSTSTIPFKEVKGNNVIQLVFGNDKGIFSQ